MKKLNWKKPITASMAAMIFASQAFADYSHFVVTGNSRIQDSIVLGTAGLTEGTSASAADLNAAVQRLFASGIFSDAKISVSGNTATISVVENATISGVFFEGNDKIKDEALASVTKLGPRDGLDKAKIEEDVQSIRRVYAARSRFDVGIKPVVINNNNGTYKLVYEIDEGTISEIDRVTFSGNSKVADWTLRRVVVSQESGLFSSIFSRDNFATEKLDSDRAAILDYYQENGFYKAEVQASDADYSAGGNFYLSYKILEGQQYRFGNVSYQSTIPGVSGKQFARFSKITPGGLYRASEVRKTIESIEHEAEIRGLPFLRANPIITTDENGAIMDIVFELRNENRTYVERIDIHGNENTIDRVIRRKFQTIEGDPLNSRKLKEARQDIERLGYFSNVSVNARDGSSIDQKIIDVEVEEADTGSIGFGGTYDGSDGWSVNGNLNERNFMGRGQYVGLNLELGSDSQTGKFSFAEPALFDRDVLGGFDIYYQLSSSSASAYESTNIGFEPRLSFPTGENSNLSLGYFLRSNEIRDVSETASPLVKADEGTVLTSGLSATWSIDKTDSVQSATKGWIFRIGGKVAGVGGDAQWAQAAAKFKYFRPIWRDDITASIELEGGTISSLNEDGIRINERYFLGGSKGLKGFSSGGLGPRDYYTSTANDGTTSEINSALGGNNFAAARAQMTFPLGLPDELNINGAVYYEMGSVWGLDNTAGGMGEVDDTFNLRQSRGLSFLWDLGGQTVSFNINDPFKAEDYDVTDNYTISFVTKF